MLYFLRHGQTNWNLERKTQGRTDVPLNEAGRTQVRERSRQLADLRIGRIVTSDLSRARETAEIVNQTLHLPLSEDTRLREIDYGDLEGVPRNELDENSWERFNRDPLSYHAEDPAHVFARVKSFLEDYRSSHETVLAVTHGGVLRMIMFYVRYNAHYDASAYLYFSQSVTTMNAQLYALDWERNLITALPSQRDS